MKISPQEPHVSPSSKELRRVIVPWRSWEILGETARVQLKPANDLSKHTKSLTTLFSKKSCRKPILQIFNLSIYQPIPTTPDLVAELEVAIALLLQANYPARRRDKPGKCSKSTAFLPTFHIGESIATWHVETFRGGWDGDVTKCSGV